MCYVPPGDTSIQFKCMSLLKCHKALTGGDIGCQFTSWRVFASPALGVEITKEFIFWLLEAKSKECVFFSVPRKLWRSNRR